MGKKTLLVEGTDDKHVIMHICGNRDGPCLDKIKRHGNVEDLIDNLAEELRAAVDEDDVVGVVVDADTNIANRWQAIRNQILRAGYTTVPEEPRADGTIISRPNNKLLPRMGVWIMPNNRTDGILENFLKFLIPRDDPLFGHAEACVASIPDGAQRFKDIHKPKAMIHTWLAWQEEPGKPYGTAITARFLDPCVPEANVLVSWLRRLFLDGQAAS